MSFSGYGEVFRTIREQKGYSFSFFEKVGIEKSNLSKFERGISVMSIERVDIMLQEMNVSLGEYELMINNFVADYQEEFLQLVDEADISGDSYQLEKLYQEAFGYGYKWLALSVKGRLGKLSESEMEELTEFLGKIKQWGYFELSLVYLTVDNFKTEMIQEILWEIDAKSNNYYQIFKYRRRIFQIVYRAVAILVSRNETKLANLILKMTEIKDSSHELFASNLRCLIVGYYNYIFRDKEKALEEMTTSLDLFERLDSKKMRDYYQNKLIKLIEPDKNPWL